MKTKLFTYQTRGTPVTRCTNDSHNAQHASRLIYLTRYLSGGILPLAVIVLLIPALASLSRAQCPAKDTMWAMDSVYTDKTDSAWQCYIIGIRTGSDPSPVTSFIVKTFGKDAGPGWFCSIDIDSAYKGHHGISHFTDPNWREDLSDTAYTDSTRIFDTDFVPPTNGALMPCDTGFIKLCLCCNGGQVYLPFEIILRHADGTTDTSSIWDPNWYTWPCSGSSGTWPCWQHCDNITTKEYTEEGDLIPEVEIAALCVTIHHVTPGDLRHFSLSFSYPNQPTGCTKYHWTLLDAPSHWHEDLLAPDTASFSDPDTTALKNCDSATFCFTITDCSPKCFFYPIVIKLYSDGDSLGCTSSDTINDPSFGFGDGEGDETNCCVVLNRTVITPGYPTQNMTTGIWTECFTVHRSNSDPLSEVVIDHCHTPGSNNPRCWQVSSIPWGWKLSGSSGCVDTFKITTAADTGCRTFEWCYQTCSCESGGPWTNDFNISDPNTGDNFPVFDDPITIASDNGNCCDGVFYTQDSVQLVGISSNCVMWKWKNTHYPGCCEGSFVFTIPVGCTVTSLTGLPAGWFWAFNPSSHQVSLTGPANGSDPLCTCGEIDVTVCCDCALGDSIFTSNWTAYCAGGTVGGSGSATYDGPGHKVSTGSIPQDMIPADGGPNFPNPVDAASGFRTTIPFVTSRTGMAYIRIVDAKGTVVLRDNEEVSYAGKHFFYFTAKDLPAGTYYYQIEFPKGIVIVSRTMIVVR